MIWFEPCGAAAQGERVCLRAHAPRWLYPQVSLALWADAGDFRIECAMEWVDLDAHGEDVYETVLDTGAMRGLYWYRACDGETMQLSDYDPAIAPPGWYAEGVTYHVFVDRFFRGDPAPLREDADFKIHRDMTEQPDYLPDASGEYRNRDIYGGDLLGVLKKLPYLQSLGVKTIYLSPIFEAWSNHKYNTADFETIDAHFGNAEVLNRLCRAAAARGMRVILDGVFNHVGSDSVYFNREGRYSQPGAWQAHDSRYGKWFHFTGEKYDSWWGIKTLPAVDKNNADYRAFNAAHARRWMAQGVAGWRLDVADELPDDFLRGFYETVKQKKNDALILGEVWEDASNKIAYSVRRKYFTERELDGVMNYPLRDAILSFVGGRITAEQAREVMEMLCTHYPKPILHCLMNHIGTHDTPRALTMLVRPDIAQLPRAEQAHVALSEDERAHAKVLLRRAAVLQFAFPGSPAIYYGDEAGMEGGADPFNRAFFPWGREDAALTAFYHALGWLKTHAACMQHGDFRVVAAEQTLLCVARQLGEERMFFGVGAPGETVWLPSRRDLFDIWSGRRLRAHFGRVCANVPACGYFILTNTAELVYNE